MEPVGRQQQRLWQTHTAELNTEINSDYYSINF
jgi:hypothetical protein